jgi:serine/threonine-protein kinase
MDYPTIRGFEIKSVIGKGGMGTVYHALRKEDSAEVAIKVLHSHLTDVQEFIKRFHKEAKLAEKIAHPRVARVIASGEQQGCHYIVMELVQGEKLSQRLAKDAKNVPLATLAVFKGTETPSGATTEVSKPLPTDAVIKMMRQIAAVLEEARQLGLVHRDIKPDNIIVDDEWNVKLLDFGIAKDTKTLDSVLSLTGQTLGTPPYMSPEQCKGAKDIDTRSDLYSLGVVAYQCLSGHVPFPGPTTPAFINQHLTEIPRPLTEANPKIPKNLSQVIDRLLAKDPNNRHQTPVELLEDLNRVERGEAPVKIYHAKKKRAGERRRKARIWPFSRP